MPILEVRGLVKIYGRRRVVDGVDFEVNPGEVVGLLGPNGAGKTTVFYMITGLITPDYGRIHLDGSDITGLPMYRRARLGIGRRIVAGRGLGLGVALLGLGVALQERVALELALDIGDEVEVGELQQLDGLHQLRRHHQRLALPQFELGAEGHDTQSP